MVQFIAFVSTDGVAPNHSGEAAIFENQIEVGHENVVDISSTIIWLLLNRPNCRKLPLSLIRQTQGSKDAREISFRWSQAQRVKGFINNNYREDLERKRSLAKEEKVPNRPTAKVPDVSTPLHGYTQPPVRHFTKLSYAWCSRINYPYKTHQSFLYFLLSAYTFALCTRRFGFKKIL